VSDILVRQILTSVAVQDNTSGRQATRIALDHMNYINYLLEEGK